MLHQNRIVFEQISDEIKSLWEDDGEYAEIKIQVQYQLPYSLTREGLNSYTD